mmetsp:Transcript_41317/g.83397  ORF Transcript_41317/g.83397 Transcript_41317/m.83397 type:complete len:298 (-) Transcript_41317:21-914(-)|eukprot:CAMPEP_0171665246 /NCGR_PEP_ID=MMETSP0990-20121206/47344_1 /TAXON_ID=483369 /ORGANISM="non described non described, Strain CCMP2098" /LENGTH=297 /DNA_ID=CAMNT_0012248437 /DNA_START=17 /DNA_END=910 /DNA_ORIENTATION=-
MMLSPVLRRGALRKSTQTLAARSIHASAPVRDEEKSAAAPATGGILSDIRVQLPLGFIAAIPLIQNQIFILNEETQLLGCFMVFVGTMYSQAGDTIGKALDAKGEAVISEHNAQEEIAISAVRSVLAAHEQRLTLVEDMKIVYDAQSELLGTLASAKSMELQYMLRADIIKKLDYISLKEEGLKTNLQSSLVTKVTAAVTKSFEESEQLRKVALFQGLATICDPAYKHKEDVVACTFNDMFQGYAKDIASKSGTTVDIPEDIIEYANAEILALRKRSGDDNTDLSGLGFADKKMVLE